MRTTTDGGSKAIINPRWTEKPCALPYFNTTMLGADFYSMLLRNGVIPFRTYPPYHLYEDVDDSPLVGQFSKSDCSATKRVPAPNDTSSESSRRDVSNADYFGAGAIPPVEISTMENRPRGG